MKDLRVMGAEPEMIAAWRKAMAPGGDDFLVLPDVYDSVRVFDAMGTQWDRAGTDGTKVGLKFSRAPVFMRMLGVKADSRRQVFEDLLVLERETLLVYSERRT